MSSTGENSPELIPMRPDERIDPIGVGKFLEGKLPSASGTPEIEQFAGGHANLTYLLRYPDREYVLRRPPLGPVAARSHDMGREYRVLSVLYKAYALAPRAYLFSEDASAVGAPFLIMERRRGIVIRQEMPARYLARPELYRRMSEAIIDAMVELHAVDPAAVGLEKLGRPQGFMERQVDGWYHRWEAAKTEEVPLVEEVAAWLRGNIPPAQSASLVHLDFKLDNAMLDGEDPATIVAVLDWDMGTLGDPLIDLGLLLGYWAEAGDSEDRSAFRAMPTHLAGFYTRGELVARYGERSGKDMGDIRFYEIFALFRLGVVLQQMYVRWFRGQTQDERFRDHQPRVGRLMRMAWNHITA
jgi:aminoglycoside phosphotransferase (APT) family kinase protein